MKTIKNTFFAIISTLPLYLPPCLYGFVVKKNFVAVVNVAKVLGEKSGSHSFFNRFLVYREKRHVEYSTLMVHLLTEFKQGMAHFSRKTIISAKSLKTVVYTVTD